MRDALDLWATKSSAETRGKHALKPMSGAVFVLAAILLHCPVSSSKVSCSISFRRNAAFLPKGDRWTVYGPKAQKCGHVNITGMVGLLFGALLANSTLFLISCSASAGGFVFVWTCQCCFSNTEPPSTISCNPPHHHHHKFPKCMVCYKSFVPRSDECCFLLPTIGLPTEVVLSSLDGAGKC